MMTQYKQSIDICILRNLRYATNDSIVMLQNIYMDIFEHSDQDTNNTNNLCLRKAVWDN